MRKAGIKVGLSCITALGCATAVQFPAGTADDPGCQKTASFKEFTSGVRKAGLFTGGPTQYADVGRRTLAKAVDVGLLPTDTVLDIGAGSLRIGWWLVQYIEPRNYYAIEPAKKRIDTAAKLLGVEIHTFYNYDFEFPEKNFDFVLARSIWSHASKAMISKMLSEFAENASPTGKFLASVYFANEPSSDYEGKDWIDGKRKHKGKMVVAHSRAWVEAAVAKHGLKMTVSEKLHGQIWVLIERAS